MGKSRQETRVGQEWLDAAKRQAQAEKELEVEKWVTISFEIKQNGEYIKLHRYEMPCKMLQKWLWVVHWRACKLQCQYPRAHVNRIYDYHYRHKGKYLGWQKDINQLVACKGKVTKWRNVIAEYIESQRDNMFFDESTDEQLLKARAKLQRAEDNIAAAEARMKEKLAENGLLAGQD